MKLQRLALLVLACLLWATVAGAAIAFRQPTFTTGATNTTSATAPVPAGAQSGDLLVALVWDTAQLVGSNPPVTFASTGAWTVQATGNAQKGAIPMAIMTCPRSSCTLSSYVFTQTGDQVPQVLVAMYAVFDDGGQTVSWDVGSGSSCASATSCASPSITPSASADPYELVLVGWGAAQFVVTPNVGTMMQSGTAEGARIYPAVKGSATFQTATSGTTTPWNTVIGAFKVGAASSNRIMLRGAVDGCCSPVITTTPTNVVSGDINIAYVRSAFGNAITTPAGCSQLANQNTNVYAVYSCGTASSYSFTNGHDGNAAYFFDMDGTPLAIDTKGLAGPSGSATSYTGPTITTGHNNSIVVTHFSSGQTITVSDLIIGPSGATDAFGQAGYYNGSTWYTDSGSMIGYFLASTAGTTTARTASQTNAATWYAGQVGIYEAPPPPPVFLSGWETGVPQEWGASGANCSVVSPGRNSMSGYQLKCLWGATNSVALFTGFTSPGATIYARFGLTTTATNATTDGQVATVFELTNNGGTTQYSVQLVTHTSGVNALRLFNNAAGAQVGSDSPVSTAVAHFVEMKIVQSATVGTMELKLDGASIASGSGLNTGTSGIQGVRTGSGSALSGASGSIWIDDVIVSGTGYLGDGYVIGRGGDGQSGAPTYNNWTFNGCSPNTIYGCWNSVPMASATPNASSTPNAIAQTMLIEPFNAPSSNSNRGPSSIGSGVTINGAVVMVWNNTTTNSTLNIRRRISGTNTDTTYTHAGTALQQSSIFVPSYNALNGLGGESQPEIGGTSGNNGTTTFYDATLMVDAAIPTPTPISTPTPTPGPTSTPASTPTPGPAGFNTNCTNLAVNLQGANGDLIIDNTAGGVTVAKANALRCSLTLNNTAAFGSGADIRCCSQGGVYACVPTSTVGVLIQAGKVQGFGPEGQYLWKCIRTGATSAALEVTEALP